MHLSSVAELAEATALALGIPVGEIAEIRHAAEVHDVGKVARLVRSSHERWEGTGYPDRLAGKRIPRGARIVAVADAPD